MTLRRLYTLLFVAVVSVGAYSQTGSIVGSVSDSTGAMLPGAKVTATNVATQAVRTVQSGPQGNYVVSNLPAGKYDVTIEKDGLAVAKYPSIQLTVDQVLSINAKLQTGTVTAVIEVSAAAVAPIDLATSQISNVVDQRTMTDLPLLTRNPYELVLLSPGTMQSNSGLGGFSVNGSRERNNNFLLDGVDNNDTSVPGIPGGVASLNPDATQEFRVITNNFLPEFGRNTGAVIDVVTKSGTNDFHGTGYWFGRYNALAARDYFNRTPQRQDPFVRNDFGGSVGGPIIKNKTFFFFNDEYQRFRTTVTNTSIVPTAAFKTGIFQYQPNDRNCAPNCPIYNVDVSTPGSANNAQGLSIDPTVKKLFALLPNPNGTAAEAPDMVRGIYRFPSSSAQDSANVTFKLDHRVNDKHNISVRYVYGGSKDPNPFHADFAPGLGLISSEAQTHGIAASLTSTFSPSLVNEFKFGFNKTFLPFNCLGLKTIDGVSAPDQFGKGTDFTFAGILGGGNPGFGCQGLGDSNGQSRKTGTWSYADSFTWVHDRHTMKFGGDFRYVFENGFDAFGSRATLTFLPYSNLGMATVNLDPNNPCDSAHPKTTNCGDTQIQDLVGGLLGVVDSQTQSQFFDKGSNRTAVDNRSFRQHEYSAFAQDSWKITSKLTLNLGVRYQFNGVPFEVNNNLSNLFANASGTAPFTFTLVGPGTGKLLYNNDFKDVEPRVGFSWDPFGKGNTAIRGGYGIFHDRIFGNLFGNARGNPPFQQSFQVFPGAPLSTLPGPTTLPTSLTVADNAFNTPVLFDPNLKIPYSQNWNFGIQQQIFNNLDLEVDYVASKGDRILRNINANQPIPALVNALIAGGASPAALQGTNLYLDGTTNNTAFFQPSLNESTGFSTYNSLQAKVTKRLQHGIQIQGAYTWAHGIDDASDPLAPAAGNRGFPRNSFNLREERGNSDFDIRNRLVVNYLAELPFGRGRAYLNTGVIGRVLEGWQLSGISSVQDGHPYDIFGNRDSEHTSLNSRVDLVGNPAIPSGSPRTQTGPPVNAFGLAPFGRGGDVGRNTFVGPGVINTDAVLSKNTKFTERFNMDTRFEFYNLFNRVQLGQPGNSIASPGTFGLSTSTVLRSDGTTSARQIQFAMKLHF